MGVLNVYPLQYSWPGESHGQRSLVGFPGGLAVNNLPAVQETWVQPLGCEDPLE